MPYGYLTTQDGFTLETWFKRAAVPVTEYAAIFSQTSQSNNGGGTGIFKGRQLWVGFLLPGEISIKVWKENKTEVLDWEDPADPASYNDNNWHHLIVTLSAADEKTFAVYIDGEPLDTVDAEASSTIEWGAGRFTVGGEYSPHRGQYGQTVIDCSLAYTAVYDYEFTEALIAEHYAAGTGGAVFSGETEVDRINRLLDIAQVPESQRLIEDPVSTLLGIEIGDSNALEKIEEAELASSGGVFADGQGMIKYHNRAHVYNRYIAATLSESLGAAPEVAVQFSTSSAYIYNDIRGKMRDSNEVRLLNQASISRYGNKPYNFEVILSDPDELRALVSYIRNQYGTDRVRISGVVLSAETSEIAARIATGQVEIGDVIAFDELDATRAPSSYMEFVVESIGISADFRGRKWSVPLELSPGELTKVFQVGVSQLGDGSVVAY